MNKEQQYRTGNWPAPDAVPEWAFEALARTQHQQWLDVDVVGRARTLMADLCTPDTAGDAGRALLGISDGIPEMGLLAHTKAMIAAAPEREAELWDAMWAARRHTSQLEEYLRLLPSVAAVYEERLQYREQGWPRAWDVRSCDLWRDLEGTPTTARAWARAGWNVAQVITERVQVEGRVLTLAERLAALRPPRRQPDNAKTARAVTPVRSLHSSQGGTR